MIDLITYGALAAGAAGGFLTCAFLTAGKVNDLEMTAAKWRDNATVWSNRTKEIAERLAIFERKEVLAQKQRKAAGKRSGERSRERAAIRKSMAAQKTAAAIATTNFRPRDEVVADIAFRRAEKESSGAAG